MKNHVLATILSALISFTFYSCKKDKNSIASKWEGTYSGNFHQVAGCYTCVPYLDSTFAGLFSVRLLQTDSIAITRLYDNYSWHFVVNDSNEYYRWWCCTVGESFTFREPDSLIFCYNNGGGGGYMRETFEGKK